MERYLRHRRSKQNINVLLADHQQLVREGIKRILSMEEDMVVVGECSDGAQVLECCSQHRPDVVLMDRDLPAENGKTFIAQLQQAFPNIKIMILSNSDHEHDVIQALYQGADGYLLKDMEADTFIHAIRSVYLGYGYVHPKAAARLVQQLPLFQLSDSKRDAAHRHSSAMQRLTRREADILTLIVEGKSTRTISECLQIHEKTVKNHVCHLLRKLGVRDRTQAVIQAYKNGWIKKEEQAVREGQEERN